jgi:hypothetical protein
MAKKQGMTEAEWLACDCPQALLEHLEGLARRARQPFPNRKLRLFACACGRRAWPLLGQEASRAAVEVGEQFADAELRSKELNRACRAAARVKDDLDPRLGFGRDDSPPARAAFFASAVAMWSCASSAREAAGFAAGLLADAVAASAGKPTPGQTGAPGCADLVREVFGNPFRAAAVERAWLAWDGGAVPKLARSAYDERQLPEGTLDAGRLGVLADALEEAGCDDADLLGHLRGDGPHVRGCWAVDTLLDRP